MHTLAREVRENTGLEITRIVAKLEPFFYHPEKEVARKVVRQSCVQLNYVLDVQDDTITVDLNNHSLGIRAKDEESEELEMTDGMRGSFGQP